MPAIDNRPLLRSLLERGTARLRAAPWLELDPAPPPPAGGFDPARVEGMLWGVAVGDSLGKPSEAMIPERRRQTFGEVRDYHRSRRARRPAEGEVVEGEPSDDTQMTFWTLEQLLEDGGLRPERLSDRLARDGRYLIGGGQTVREFCRNAERGAPWEERGVPSAGNGSLMRISPFLLPHLRQPSPALWADVALGALLTHNDPAANAACLAFAAMLWRLLGAGQPPTAPGWWIDTFLELARPLEVPGAVYAPRGGSIRDFSGTLCDWIELRRPEMEDRGRRIVEVCDATHSGAYLLETVPCVLTILSRCAADPEEAIVRAVNDTKDNDTAASVVGAAVGALHGREGLPRRWREGLSGRLRRDGPRGEVPRLIGDALQAFCP